MRKLLLSAILTLALLSGAMAVLTVNPQLAMACEGSSCS